MSTQPAIKHWRQRWRHELAEQGLIGMHLARWIALGGLAGILAGISSWLFLEGLHRITAFRVAHGWLLGLLPIAGLAVGSLYHHLGGRSSEGNALLIEQIHNPQEWVPRRMAPFVLAGTWVTHLFGGSAGREGTALQMSGTLSDTAARALRLKPNDRSILLVSAVAGGFGAVFGVPLAGAVFAMEVQSIGRLRYNALVPALTASLVGNLVVQGLGYQHTSRTPVPAHVDPALLVKVAAAGLLFGLAGAVFAELTHAVKGGLARLIPYAPLRTFTGGIGVVGLALLFGSEYLGLSLPLIDRGLAGDRLSFAVFALKLVFTVITLGSGFPGGEVTPLFVIGTTLGAALAAPLHLPVALLAAVGFVAVFAGAANTPLACTIMGVEIFGNGIILPLAIACVVSYVFSNHRGIYSTQRIDTAKGPTRIDGSPTLASWRTTPPVTRYTQRRRWR